jgi:guanine deaminase
VAAHRDPLARSLHERLFAWMTLCTEASLVASYVAGERRHSR